MSKENQVPHKIDPFRMADHAMQFERSFSLKDMTRLHESLSNQEGEVTVDFEFGKDTDQHVQFVRFTFRAELSLQCQRCLEPFSYPIQGQLQAGLVHNEEEARRLPKEYDPVIVKDGTIALQDVVEDELIIGLPIVPMHLAKDCGVKLPKRLDSEIESEKDNPFKVIELLRSDKHNSNK